MKIDEGKRTCFLGQMCEGKVTFAPISESRVKNDVLPLALALLQVPTKDSTYSSIIKPTSITQPPQRPPTHRDYIYICHNSHGPRIHPSPDEGTVFQKAPQKPLFSERAGSLFLSTLVNNLLIEEIIFDTISPFNSRYSSNSRYTHSLIS